MCTSCLKSNRVGQDCTCPDGEILNFVTDKCEEITYTITNIEEKVMSSKGIFSIQFCTDLTCEKKLT